jgi:hypothetical protein
VLSNGTPLGRMQVSAFQAPFVAENITDSARYLGDAGRSAALLDPATSFQLTIPANTTIALVVFNINGAPAGQGGKYSIALNQALCGWSLATTGDFNGDSKPDYVLTHGTSRRTAIWYMNNNVFVRGTFGPTLPLGWKVAAARDFNTDSHTDYVLANTSTRLTTMTAIWYLNNNLLVRGAFGPTLTSDSLLVGVGNFNSDLRPDYALYGPAVGNTAIWYLNNNSKTGSADGPGVPSGWMVLAVADFNGDSKPDYLLYNATTRQTAIWLLNNNVYIQGSAAYGPSVPIGWSLVTAVDFNGDSIADYLLYNATTRQTAIWYINHARPDTPLGYAYGPTLPSN